MKPEINKRYELFVKDLGIHGEGIGHINHFTVFVENALPGEKVVVVITEVKQNYALGRLIEWIEISPNRTHPICPAFDRCGGCQLMHFSYEETLKWKEKRVKDALYRIGGLTEMKVYPCERADDPLHYRNKMQLPVVEVNKVKRIGLYEKNSHKVVDVKECFIHNPLGESVYRKAREMILASRVDLRHLFMRTAVKKGEVLVALISEKGVTNEIRSIASELMRVEGVKGVLYGLNRRKDNILRPEMITLLAGESYIHEEVLGIEVRLSLTSFFQVNLQGAESIYQKAYHLAELESNDRVLDAYCGIGLFALYLARKKLKVTGIEIAPEAIYDAKENAIRNQIEAEFIVGKAEEQIAQLAKQDVIFLNPPRKGCDKKILETIVEMKPRKVIYTSCDPSTLARDLKILKEGGYLPKEAYPFDLFPQTTHVETVVSVDLE